MRGALCNPILPVAPSLDSVVVSDRAPAFFKGNQMTLGEVNSQIWCCMFGLEGQPGFHSSLVMQVESKYA